MTTKARIDIWDDDDDVTEPPKQEKPVNTAPVTLTIADAHDDTLMTTEEAADFLRLTPKGVRTMASAGKIPSFKLGRSYRFRKRDLIEMLRPAGLGAVP